MPVKKPKWREHFDENKSDTLLLGGPHTTDDDLVWVEDLKLEYLELSNSAITDDGLAHIASLTGLRYLQLSGTQIGGSGLIHIKKMMHLQSLTLDNTRVNDDALAHLSNLLYLKTLVLDNTPISDKGLRQLKDIDLEDLQLSGTRATGRCFADMVEYNFCSLKELALVRTPVKNGDLKALSRFSALETLNISDTAISDEGLKHLGRLKSLFRLYANNTKITGSGFGRLKNCRELCIVHLEGAPIEGKHLKLFDDVKSVGELRLPETITDEDLAGLRPTLPVVFVGPLGAAVYEDDYLYHKQEPANVVTLQQTCRAFPTQWEGFTDEDEEVYIRFRYGDLYVKLGDVLFFETGVDCDGELTFEEMKEAAKPALTFELSAENDE